MLVIFSVSAFIALVLPDAIHFASAESVTITPSSDHWYGPGLIRVIISDPSKNAQGSSIAPHIDVKRGSTTLASADPAISSAGTSGTFELYLTTSNAPYSPTFPSFPNNYVVGRINSHPQTQSRDFSLTLASNDYLRDGDSIVVSYSGLSKTIEFAKSNVVASVDRTLAGDGDRITITLEDQNANIDPTAIDSFPANSSIISVVAGGATMNFSGARFIEEGQNSGSFDLVVAVTSSLGNIVNPPNGSTLQGVNFPSSAQFTLHGFAVYPNLRNGTTYPYNTVTPNPSISSSQTVTLQNSDGVISLGSNNQTLPSNGNNTSGSVVLSVRTIPTIVRADSPFWINASVTNNSTNTIQFSRVCSPFISVDFQPSTIGFFGKPCNIMAVLEELRPGQTTTIKVPGFDGQYFQTNTTGTINATVNFTYQITGQPGATGNVSEPILFSVFDKYPRLGQSFVLGYNQTVAIPQANLSARFANLSGDSRCHLDARCILQGNATVLLDIKAVPGDKEIGQFNLTWRSGLPGANSTLLFNNYKIALERLDSVNKPSNAISDYTISLIVLNQTQSVVASPPKAQLLGENNSATSASIGSKIMLESNISSTSYSNQTFVAVFEVRSLDNGITDYLGLARGTISANQTLVIVPQSYWMPQIPGMYQVRVFIIDNLDRPMSIGTLSVSELKIQ